jgi:predicted CoA-binding protein
MPKSIAVIGASSHRRKFGNKCVRAYQKLGYQVFPVHPTESMIEGMPAFPSVLHIPQDSLDVASIYLPETAALSVLPELARKSIGQVWFNPGADSPAVIAEARKLGLNAVVGCSIVAVGDMPDE